MVVDQGFKQTDIGSIPKDWEVIQIRTVADVRTGPFGSALHEKDYVQDGTPIITVEHLREHGVVHSNLPMVSDLDKQRLKAYSLQKDDVVFSRVGSVDRNSLITENEDGWLFSGRLLRIRIQSKKIYAQFLSYYFQSEPFKQRVRNVAVGQTMASLNTQIINDIEIAVPPIPEQHGIATALSDVDTLLAALDTLIAKKRLVKQGAMQELLTEKRWKPGFRETWNKKVLGNICKIEKGEQLNRDTLSLNDDYPAWNGGREPSGFTNQWNTEGNTITISEGGNSCGFVNFIKQKFWRGGHCYALKNIESGISKDYLYQFLKHLETDIMALRVGSGLPNIQRARLSSLFVFLPPLPEQTAIAETLSDMDAEIAALKQKREKTRLLKQGMMQELLTGRIRLV